LSIEDGVTKRNKNGKVLGCGTHPNMESFHHPRRDPPADGGCSGACGSACGRRGCRVLVLSYT
ncbi:MAG: hypothetical protein U9N46_02365, partial [Euryarchaeota archaeon]|nr:hypothetical protein [Euryarchaeota archaeon]